LDKEPDNNKGDPAEVAAPTISPGNKQQNSNVDPHKTRHTWVEKSAVAIAILAFLAAAGQGWVARDTEIKTLRPWLVAKSLSNYRYTMPRPNFNFAADASVKNYGQNEASDIFMTAFITASYAGVLDKALGRVCTGEDNVRYNNGFSLAPTETTEQALGIQGGNEIDDKTFELGNYFVLGCIRYTDQFGRTYKSKFVSGPPRTRLAAVLTMSLLCHSQLVISSTRLSSPKNPSPMSYRPLFGRRAAANLMSKDEARKIAAGITKLPELLHRAK
jgi:hypothetical protein